MKPFLFLALIFSTSLAIAKPASREFMDEHFVSVEKAKKFLAEKSNCYVAIGAQLQGDAPDYLAPNVICIQDGVSHQGTINEVTGCSFTLMNIGTGVVRGTALIDGSAVTVDKGCTKGGFEELMKRGASWLGTKLQKNEPTVGEAISSGKSMDVQYTTFGPKLLYADKGFEKFFDDLKANHGKTSLKYEAPKKSGMFGF